MPLSGLTSYSAAYIAIHARTAAVNRKNLLAFVPCTASAVFRKPVAKCRVIVTASPRNTSVHTMLRLIPVTHDAVHFPSTTMAISTNSTLRVRSRDLSTKYKQHGNLLHGHGCRLKPDLIAASSCHIPHPLDTAVIALLKDFEIPDEQS